MSFTTPSYTSINHNQCHIFISSPSLISPVVLVDLHGRVQLRQLFLQQLQVGVHEAQLEGDGVFELPVGGRLVEVLGSCAEAELFVDFLVQFASLVLQLSAARRDSGIRALKQTRRECRIRIKVIYNKTRVRGRKR